MLNKTHPSENLIAKPQIEMLSKTKETLKDPKEEKEKETATKVKFDISVEQSESENVEWF